MNAINLTGNMTADPIIRTNGDKKIATFTLAVKGMGEHTDFIRCTAFGKTAEYVERNGNKGARAALNGSLHIDSYEKDGKRINTAEVYIRSAEIFRKGEKKADGDPAPADYVALEDDDEPLPFN